MTTNETRRFLMLVNSVYPGWKVEDIEATVKAWHWALEEYTLDQAEKALKAYIKTNSKYIPNASQITELIETNRHKVDWDALLEELKDC